MQYKQQYRLLTTVPSWVPVDAEVAVHAGDRKETAHEENDVKEPALEKLEHRRNYHRYDSHEQHQPEPVPHVQNVTTRAYNANAKLVRIPEIS